MEHKVRIDDKGDDNEGIYRNNQQIPIEGESFMEHELTMKKTKTM